MRMYQMTRRLVGNHRPTRVTTPPPTVPRTKGRRWFFSKYLRQRKSQRSESMINK